MMHALAKSQGIKRKDTNKLFYNAFPFSLRLPYPVDYHATFRTREREAFLRYNNHPKGYTSYVSERRALHRTYRDNVDDFVEGVIEVCSPALDIANYEFTAATKALTFYLLQEEQVIGLMQGPHGNEFDEYACPHSLVAGQQLDAFKDRSALIRRMPFLGEFTYKVDFRPKMDFEELDEAVEKLFFAESSHYNYGASTRSVYLKDKSDLFIVKIALAEEIQKITECIVVE